MSSRLSGGPASFPDGDPVASSGAPVDPVDPLRFQSIDSRSPDANLPLIPWNVDGVPSMERAVYRVPALTQSTTLRPRFVRETVSPHEHQVNGKIFKTGDMVAAIILVDDQPVTVTWELSIVESLGVESSVPEHRGYVLNATDLQGDLVSVSLPVDLSMLSRLE